MTYTGENQILKGACRTSAAQYAQGKAIQCSLCQVWLYTQDRGASAEFEALADHLASNHPEIHEELLERFRNAR